MRFICAFYLYPPVFIKTVGYLFRFFAMALLVVAVGGALQAQDHTWWANNVGWDTKSHWSEYLIYSAKYMGPNALPVPDLAGGHIDNENSVRITGASHFCPGDRTYNANVYANLNLVKDIISFDLYYLPVEYFNMSHELKTERKTFFWFYYKKFAQGDTYLNTNVQLLQRGVNLKLRLGYKFPTSSMIALARFTDRPGYYFDLAFDKNLIKSSNNALRIMGMVGFYVWETNNDNQYQNDSFLYGLGLAYERDGLRLQTNLRGYHGYMENGDSPLVWKTSAAKRLGRVSVNMSYQVGLHDFKYHSLEAGVGYYFSWRRAGQPVSA